jgi:hypothetical protein
VNRDRGGAGTTAKKWIDPGTEFLAVGKFTAPVTIADGGIIC